MNKGLIYKVKYTENDKEKQKMYYIKLERTAKINEIEYNIFLDYEKPEEKKNPKAILFSIETPFKSNLCLLQFIGKKFDFEIDTTNRTIVSIEYEE